LSRNKPYSEKFKIINIEGFLIEVHVVDDLDDEELLSYAKIAYHSDNFEYLTALCAEMKLRNININKIFKE